MTTRWQQKAWAICVIVLVAILAISLIILWTAVNNGVLTSNRSIRNNKINISENRIIESTVNWNKEKHNNESTENSSVFSTTPLTSKLSSTISPTSSSENLESTQPPDIGIRQQQSASNAGLEDISNIEFIKPSKIHVQPLHEEDLLYESKKIDPNGNEHIPEHYHHHITGHFRNKSSRIWDPHPQYEIDAFGLHLHLILYHDAKFIPKDIKVTHVWPNETLRLNEDLEDVEKLQGCFYKGHVRGDEKSAVAVSLCDGMRGHIRTSSGSFFIQPYENYTNENTNILHAVYRVPTLPGIYESPLPPSSLSSGSTASLSSHEKGSSHYAVQSNIDYDWSKQESSDSSRTTYNNNNHIRNKRSNPSSVNNAYTMEVLVAVDKKMQEYHGDAINSYVLTLMSLVSSIYADASIGNSINVAVVHVLHLKHDFNLHSHRNGVSASTMLVEFCKLKQQFNFPHDTALLLTREQICRNENQTKCDTLGLAELGTMCNSYSCSIVQENGLSAAFTMAHELGHVLNMPHDDDPKCDKYRETGQIKQNIMSRMLDHNTYPWSWSNCSRHFVTEFLEKDRGKCMLNKPEHDLIKPTWPNSQLAGEKFTKDEQCELVFGPNSRICSYMPVCNRLWCSEDDRENSEGCRTQHMPWADGTKCGINRWCQKGECINRNRTALKPIDGGWGHWSRYGECSRPCGGGVHESTRACDSPAPNNGGKYCIGYRIKYKSCNTETCPLEKLDFREEQCTEQDNNNFDIPGLEKNVKWVPKYGVAPPDECKLFCRVYKSHSYFVLKDKVKDGTPCSHDSFNKCVNGVCRPAGCDNELDSTAKLDKCGVCKGRNETCLDITGSFSYSQIVRDENKAAHYYRVVKIPKGSSNLDIRQPGYGKDKNYIALMDDQGAYMLNGKNLITSYPITFPYAGVIFYYTGANNSMERVNTTYAIRLKRDMFVMILSLQPMDIITNDDFVKFSYTISKQDYDKPIKTEHERQSHGHTRKIHYQWKMSEWSECNVLCMGQKFQKPACIQMDAGLKVSPNLCHPHPKPPDQYKTCNTECELNWEMSRQECSNPCGEGESETKYNCIQTFLQTRHSNIVDASYCPSSRPPSTIEKCYGECEEAAWVYGDWEPCSHMCGSGHQNRSVTCHSSETGYPIDQNFCANIKKEYSQKLCNPEPCPEWAFGVDTPCSVTCGEGIITTAIVCKQNNVIVNAALCGSIPRPIVENKICTMEPCNKKKIERFDKDTGLSTQHFVDNNDVIHTRHSMQIPHNPIINYVPTSRYEWRTGRWGKCSISCGTGGMKTRSVRCSNLTSVDNRYVEDYYCDSSLKPVNVANCTEASCIDWTVGEWGECNKITCKRQRAVACINSITGEVDRSLCRSESMPNHNEVCCHYKWRTKLSACSGSCGAGERTRRQICMRLKPKTKDNPYPIKTGEVLPEYFCKHLKKGQIKVYKEICKRSCFRWETGPWSECSVGCGSGAITRKVTCTNGKEISATECDIKTKPTNYQQCENRNHCQWRPAKWKACNCAGIMKRRIVCVDGISKLRSNLCTEHDKPKTKMKCPAPSNCSCRKLKEKKGFRRDGEYFLNIRGKNISIYCHNMTTTNPIEYLTLAAGPQQNYASYYSRRAKDPSICPTMTRLDEWEEASLPHGTTTFSKIRIILHNLRVVEDDYTFADTGGQAKSFASAGDCYSKTEQCPQGAFSINLDGTGFRVHPRAEWEAIGPNSTIIFIDKLQPPYTKVTARCGGYCGSCYPSKKTMLHLDTNGVLENRKF